MDDDGTGDGAFGYHGAMHLIVGLGNPGSKYARTRHNLGFRAVDLLAERWGADRFDARFEGEIAKARVQGQPALLLKPQTYMNLSGASVAAAARFHRIAAENVWIVHDELDLPLGRLRIREGGGAGGHNGVKSVIERLGTPGFARFRLGVGRPTTPVPIEDYVLQPFGPTEREAADELIARTADAIQTALTDSLTKAMNVFNK